jgi:glycerophosphoryl diester phosphodiesterase
VQWPENSVSAVSAARDIGADGVEIDVWLTADKYLVVSHDRTVGRRDVPGSTRAALEGVAPIASLDDVLEAAGELRINVEIKSTRSAPYNLAVARAVAQYLDESRVSNQCLVSSFSLAICDEVRRVSPERKVGWLVTRRPADFVLDKVVASRLTSAHFPFSRVNRAVAQRAANLGVELHVWTPNLERDLDWMLELGVGALITDEVPLAMALRARHGRATDQKR